MYARMSIVNKLAPTLREMTVARKRQWVVDVMAQHAEAGLLVFGKTCKFYKVHYSRLGCVLELMSWN